MRTFLRIITFPILFGKGSGIAGTAEVRKTIRLPAFSPDGTELVISAVIERTLHKSTMFLTLFAMGHKSISYMPQMPFLMMNTSRSTLNSWKSAAKIWQPLRTLNTSHSGVVCDFANAGEKIAEKRLTTSAYWIPSHTTVDGGFNRNLEALRCKIPSVIVEQWLDGRISPYDSLSVSLCRHSSCSASAPPLIQFTVPWKYRIAGFGLEFPRRGSLFNSWASAKDILLASSSSGLFRKMLVVNNSNSIVSDKVAFAAISVVRPLEPFRMDTGIPMLLENVVHHLSIGFHHIFIGLFLDWKSVHMQRFLLALSPFIRAKRVTISSLSLRGVDDVAGPEALGVAFLDDYVRWIHQQQCLYISKGIADYLAFLQPTEFIALPIPYDNIQTFMQSRERLYAHSTAAATGVKQVPNNHRSKQRGSVNPCYHVIQSLGVPDPEYYVRDDFGPGDNHWVADFFRASVPRGPLPAWPVIVVRPDNVFMIGWHVVGACAAVAGSQSAATLPVTEVDRSKNRSEENDRHGALDRPWSEEKVRHETHADIVPWNTGAVAYFYRGKFESWQLSKPKHEINQHIVRYGSSTRETLASLGFSIRNRVLRYRVAKTLAKQLYPSYFATATAAARRKSGTAVAGSSKKNTALGTADSTKQRRGDSSGEFSSIVDEGKLVDVILTAFRTTQNEAVLLNHVGAAAVASANGRVDLSNKAHHIREDNNVVVGRHRLIARDGTWIECNGNCKNYVDLLASN